MATSGSLKFFQLRNTALNCNLFIQKLFILKGFIPAITPEEAVLLDNFYEGVEEFSEQVDNLFTILPNLVEANEGLRGNIDLANAYVSEIRPGLKKVKLNTLLPINTDGAELMFILNFGVLGVLCFIYSQVLEIRNTSSQNESALGSFVLFQKNPLSKFIAIGWILIPTMLATVELSKYTYSNDFEHIFIRLMFGICSIATLYFGTRIVWLSHQISSSN